MKEGKKKSKLVLGFTCFPPSNLSSVVIIPRSRGGNLSGASLPDQLTRFHPSGWLLGSLRGARRLSSPPGPVIRDPTLLRAPIRDKQNSNNFRSRTGSTWCNTNPRCLVWDRVRRVRLFRFRHEKGSVATLQMSLNKKKQDKTKHLLKYNNPTSSTMCVMP